MRPLPEHKDRTKKLGPLLQYFSFFLLFFWKEKCINLMQTPAWDNMEMRVKTRYIQPSKRHSNCTSVSTKTRSSSCAIVFVP